MTHADTARAVGMPPGRVESPALGCAFGDTDTHQQMDIAPSKLIEGDIYRHGPGDFRTIAQRYDLVESGETLLYFRHPHEGEGNRVVIPAGVDNITAYRVRGLRT